MKDPELMEIITSPLFNISRVDRYSGLHLARHESVSEHTTEVALMSMVISKVLERLGNTVDLGLLMIKCITHDIDEGLTGDIPRPTKYANESIRSGMDDLAQRSMRQISRDLEMEELETIWCESKCGIEGLILKVSDVLQVIKKVFDEIEVLGNKSLLRVVLEASDCTSAIRDSTSKVGLTPKGQEYLEKLLDQGYQVLKNIMIKYKDDIEMLRINQSVLTACKIGD